MSRWKKTGKTLGAGGQAQIFIVSDSTGALQGEYALKLLLNANRAPRLDLEISKMKSLVRTGAKIIPIVDDYIASEPHANRPWYVMQIANHGSLQEAITPEQCFGGTEESALRTFRKVVSAVRDLHQADVAHRDLKPANILLHDEEIVLCDLGLCLPLSGDLPEDRLTGALEQIGSRHYTPKEAFGKRPLDQNQYAFDAYALGKILYDLLAGRTLPGFTPPNDPDFDLHRIRGKALYGGINAVLRSLLHDDPAIRLSALESLLARVDSLLKWAAEKTQDIDEEKLRERLSAASEALARAATKPFPNVHSRDLKQDGAALATQIMAVWDSSQAILRMNEDLIQAHASTLEIRRLNPSMQLREIVSAPYIQTHRALEPLEEKGYPRRPTSENGCAIGIVPKTENAGGLPQLWMASLIEVTENNVHIGLALAKREVGINVFSDLITGTERVFKGHYDDPELLRRILDHARTLALNFVEQVAAECTKIEKNK